MIWIINPNETDEKYTKRVNKWMNKRALTYQEWDEIKLKREVEKHLLYGVL